jgi:TPR repeat protein
VKKHLIVLCIAAAQLTAGCGSRAVYDAALNQGYQETCKTTRQLAKEKRYDEVIRMLRPYAENGLPAAQFEVALGMVLKGDTNASSEIVFWVRKAASQNYPQALGFLDNAYRWGEYGLPTNKMMAGMWENAERDESLIPECLAYERTILSKGKNKADTQR